MWVRSKNKVVIRIFPHFPCHIFRHFLKALAQGHTTAKFCGQKFKNGEHMAMGAKNRKPPLSGNLWNLVHIFWYFCKALGQGYTTPKFCGPKFKNNGYMAIGAKIRKPPLSRKWLILVHIFQHFSKVREQGYTTPKFCGPKFKNSEHMAMGAKNRKPPLSGNLWILIHIFWYFWKAIRQRYTTPKFFGPKFKNGGDMAMGAKIGKPPLSQKWWTLVYRFCHFWKALGQGYMTPKFCGSKFKNGGDMAMGTKTGKPPLLNKLRFFPQKIRLTLEKKHLRPKRLFSRKKNLGVTVTPTKNFFLKILFSNAYWKKTHFREKKISGVRPYLDPQIWTPPNFSTFRRHLNIVWKFRRDRLPQRRRYSEGEKIEKPPLSRKWRTLVHIFWHFWKALGQGYMTPKFCGYKFKNGGDMAMGARNRKTPTFEKNSNFSLKNTSDLREKHMHLKSLF